MAIDLITLALARKYTKDAVNGLGVIKGAPCTVDSVIDNGVSNVITLKWTGVDGADQTSVVEIQHGIGIANIQIDDDGSLICEQTDGSLINAGKQPASSSSCTPDACKCIDVATDEDVDPLLSEIGIFDLADYALLDELNNPLISDDSSVLLE